MNKNIFLIFSLFTLLFSSCKKEPEACIELSANSAGVGVPVEFMSCSKRALSYEWFISGPSIAPENNQGWSDEVFSHAFSVAGTYTITLNAYQDFSFTGNRSVTQTALVIN